MTDTRTKLARAAHKCHHENMWPNGVKPVWKNDGAFEEGVWLNVVDAILVELLEPGEGALAAGRQALRDGGLLPAYTDEVYPGQPPVMQLLLGDAHRAILTHIKAGK